MTIADSLPPGPKASPSAGPAEEMHAELLATVRAATASWYERQQRTQEALSALLHALLVHPDPVRTAEAWMDWQAGALGRLHEEARDSGRYRWPWPGAAATGGCSSPLGSASRGRPAGLSPHDALRAASPG